MEIYFPKDKDKKDKDDKKDNAQQDNDEAKALKQKDDKNQFENYNINEKNEKDLRDKLEGDSQLTVVYKNSIEFDMSIQKREVRMKKEDKHQMEKMRRWKVRISNIYITPLVKMIDPFLQFTLGGNFMVNVYKNKKGGTYKIPVGSRGYTDKTDVLENVNTPQDDGTKGGRTGFEKTIDIEIRMSYAMINKQKMMIELWEHNNFWMNEIHAYITLPLINIVNGDCNVGEYFMKRESGRKNPIPFAYVDFKCIFQEIWDFKLSFLNWKCSSIFPPKKVTAKAKDPPSTQIKIELMNSGVSSHSKTISEVSAPSEYTNI